MKPVSISTKDWLVQGVAKDLEVEESLVNIIISWSYLKAQEKTQEVNSVELSGFGKLLLSEAKTKRRIRDRELKLPGYIRRMEELEEGDKKEMWKKRVEGYKRELAWLKNRLKNETCLEGHNFGLEK